MKNEKGITLTSLVIAIIVILILASISIYSGTSTLRYTKYNKARAEIQTIHAQVCEWYDEYLKDDSSSSPQEVLSYGVAIREVNNDETIQTIEDTFGGAGVNDENIQAIYRFFSEKYLKEKLDLDASFDYLIDIRHRDVILVGGVYYNGKSYFTLKDFGINNVENNYADSISFNIEPGENKTIIISDIKLHLTNNTTTDISKFIVEYVKADEENSNWIDVTKSVVKFEDGEENNKKTKYKFSVDSFGEYDVRVRTTDKNHGDIKDIILEARPGIKVGDYIKYTSPTESVTLSRAETGDIGEQTLVAEDTFRVMDIDQEGNMTLMGAMTSENKKYFHGFIGYNNAVYTLNKKCSDLYKDTSKGITARSIKVEDIIDRMIEGTKGDTVEKSTGIKKLEKYQDEEVAKLSTGTYITAIDTTKNTVTYIENKHYPDIFQYEVGGMINSTATTGIITQSESYSGYGGLTNLEHYEAETSLTVPYTYYNTSHSEDDFDDTKGNAAAYQNMFFETNINYWFASRSCYCGFDFSYFGLRCVDEGEFDDDAMYSSDNDEDGYGDGNNVCPVVYIPSSVNVKVTASTEDNSTYHKSKPHEVK